MQTCPGSFSTNPAIKTVLVTGVDIIHRLNDPNDPSIFMWSDGAGAAILRGGNLQGFVGAAFQADGAYASDWGSFAGGTFEPASAEAVKAGFTQMREVRRIPGRSTKEAGRVYSSASPPKTTFTADDVDQLLFTQINKSVIEIASKGCGVPMEKCHTIIGEIRLHWLCLYPDGIGRRHRTRQDQTG